MPILPRSRRCFRFDIDLVIAGGIAAILVISHFTFQLIEKPARKALLSAYAARQARPLPTAG